MPFLVYIYIYIFILHLFVLLIWSKRLVVLVESKCPKVDVTLLDLAVDQLRSMDNFKDWPLGFSCRFVAGGGQKWWYCWWINPAPLVKPYEHGEGILYCISIGARIFLPSTGMSETAAVFRLPVGREKPGPAWQDDLHSECLSSGRHLKAAKNEAKMFQKWSGTITNTVSLFR